MPRPSVDAVSGAAMRDLRGALDVGVAPSANEANVALNEDPRVGALGLDVMLNDQPDRA